MNCEQNKRLWKLAFGDSDTMTDNFFSTAYAPDRCRFLQEGNTVVAALYWLDGELDGWKYAYIYGVATHPEYRGKGLCRKLMTLTHRDLQNLGYAGVLLMPADAGLRTMYAGFGYRECTRISEFSCTAAEQAVAVRRVSLPEYARLRRERLPRGGLIQEGENLEYLSTYACFYAGEDFVRAAVHEEDNLFVPELLGDPACGPGILKAMGYGSGTFRTPGEDMAFAMYLPLQEAAPMPSYLGLAFD